MKLLDISQVYSGVSLDTSFTGEKINVLGSDGNYKNISTNRKIKETILQDGDIALNANIASFNATVFKKINSKKYTISAFMFIIRLHNAYIYLSNSIVFYLNNSLKLKHQLERNSPTGTTMHRIPINEIKNIKIDIEKIQKYNNLILEIQDKDLNLQNLKQKQNILKQEIGKRLNEY